MLSWLMNRFGGKQIASPPPSRHRENETAKTEEMRIPKEIQGKELKEIVCCDNPPLLLDVRETVERRNSGWIPGSTHIPMNEVPARMEEMDNQRPIVVYCARGMRSYQVAAYLLQNGFANVSNLSGGFYAWDGDKEY